MRSFILTLVVFLFSFTVKANTNLNDLVVPHNVVSTSTHSPDLILEKQENCDVYLIYYEYSFTIIGEDFIYTEEGYYAELLIIC